MAFFSCLKTIKKTKNKRKNHDIILNIIGGTMKEEILKLLDDKYEALDLIEINDLLNLTTPEDLKLLEKTLNALVD